MSEINWDLAPEGAVALKQDVGRWKNVTWIHADGSWWDDNDATWNTGSAERDWVQTIAVRSVIQTKTVEDAVEAFPDGWENPEYDCIAYNPSSNTFEYYVHTFEINRNWYHVCTREQFEACAAKNGEKWTHTYGNAGYKCKVISVDGEHSWILTENGDKLTFYTSSIKPIKPTLTKAEAWDLCQEYGGLNPIAEVMKQYDII